MLYASYRKHEKSASEFRESVLFSLDLNPAVPEIDLKNGYVAHIFVVGRMTFRGQKKSASQSRLKSTRNQLVYLQSSRGS